MDPDRILPLVLPVLALLATNAFFVTAEFALLSAQRARLEPPRDGARRSVRLLGTSPPLEEVLLLAQLGSSVSSLALGFAVARAGWTALEPRSLSLLAALLVVATVHAVFSAQLPKLVGIHRAAGRVARAVVLPVQLLTLLLRPLLWLLCRITAGASRLLGVAGAGFQPLVNAPDQIRILVTQGHELGVVEEDEREMIHGVFDFSDTVAREVMTPRIDIIAVPVEISLAELVRVVIDEGHSRLPVYEGNIDSVVGVLLAKDLLPLLSAPAGEGTHFDIRQVMREPYFVPDTKPVDDILAEFRLQSVHLAIVLDEFGGTYGLLTMEDLLEEIVGEINDEYDVAEPEFAPTPEGDVLIDGGASISEVNERFGLALPEADFDTIGGYIFGALGRVPLPGDEVAGLGADQEATLYVEEIEDRRITRVRLVRSSAVEETVPDRQS